MNALEVIGAVSSVYFGFRIFLLVGKCIIAKLKAPKNKQVLHREKDRWALVTGATHGIGKAYANALAKKGIKVVLISRSLEKLNATAQEINEKYRVETKVVAVDFTDEKDIYGTIKSAIGGLEVGVLINNIGISYDYPELFLDIPEREKLISDIVKANIISVTRMCEMIMPQMVKRRSGIVINISSLSAQIPSPYLTFYAASKSFVEKFSNDLRVEYEDKGLVIQTVLPGYVVSNMSKIRKPTWMAPSPETFVNSALSKVGIHDYTTGYYVHTLLLVYMDFMVNICKPLALRILRSTLKGMRNKAVAKQGRSKNS